MDWQERFLRENREYQMKYFYVFVLKKKQKNTGMFQKAYCSCNTIISAHSSNRVVDVLAMPSSLPWIPCKLFLRVCGQILARNSLLQMVRKMSNLSHIKKMV